MRKNGEQIQQEKVDGLQGANPVLPQVEGPPSGNSRKFFSSHFWSCSRFSRNKTFMSRTLQLPFFLKHFFGVKLVRIVQIFEPVGKKLLGRHALGGDFCRFVFVRFGQKKQMRKNGEQTKQEEKVDCLQGANPVLPQVEGPPRGGELSIIFFIAFLELFQIFKKQHVYEPNFATPNFFYFFSGKIGKRGSNFWAPGEEAVGQTRFGNSMIINAFIFSQIFVHVWCIL